MNKYYFTMIIITKLFKPAYKTALVVTIAVMSAFLAFSQDDKQEIVEIEFSAPISIEEVNHLNEVGEYDLLKNKKAGAKSFVFKKEVLLSGNWSDVRKEPGGKQSIGFEALKIFSGERGDWGKVLCQFRLVRYDNAYMLMSDMKMPLMHLNEFSTWAPEFHDAYFEYSGKFKGRFNLRLGHFDVPFGLEENEDTHTSLVQLMSMHNIGFKKDWGFSILGKLTKLDYNIALTMGSGIYPINRNRNFLLSGRVGTPADENIIIGISGIYGNPIDQMGVMRGMKMEMMMGMGNGMGMTDTMMKTTWFGDDTKPKDNIINRWRMGVDITRLIGPFALKGEVSYGADVNQEVLNGLIQVDYNVTSKLLAITQFQYAYQDISDDGSKKDDSILFGINYKLSSYITLMTSFRHDIERLKYTRNENTIWVQLYFYW